MYRKMLFLAAIGVTLIATAVAQQGGVKRTPVQTVDFPPLPPLEQKDRFFDYWTLKEASVFNGDRTNAESRDHLRG
jgi:hypothetical protein